MPSMSESQSGFEAQHEDVLTLPEAAAYLRVKEKSLAEMAASGNVPGREIEGEWRFSRRAIEDWLRFPGIRAGDYWRIHWFFESPFMEEFLLVLEKRMHLSQRQAEGTAPKPGSKQAVLKRFGILSDAGDLQEQLEIIRKRREAGG
jgi:hypothetical protein